MSFDLKLAVICFELAGAILLVLVATWAIRSVVDSTLKKLRHRLEKGV